MKRLQIVSDGTPQGTNVYIDDPDDQDTPPERVPRVTAVSWRMTNEGLAETQITVKGVPIDASVDRTEDDIVEETPQ